jgi:hypothetical protein
VGPKRMRHKNMLLENPYIVILIATPGTSQGSSSLQILTNLTRILPPGFWNTHSSTGEPAIFCLTTA